MGVCEHPWKDLEVEILNMPLYRNFTTTYSTTEKAGFWSNYMKGLKGPLCAQDPPPKVEEVPLWDRVTSADVTLYDVLFGAEETPEVTESSQEVVDYAPIHTSIYGTGRCRTTRIS